MPTVVSRDELFSQAGQPRPPSPWLRIDQDRIDLFADATGDHQFIHVDPKQAAKTPLGGTVAHGFLSLSLIPYLMAEEALVPEGVAMALNYGLNKVRFLQPVKVGSRVRLQSKVLDVSEKKPGHILVTQEATVEIEGASRPALVAEMLAMYVLRSEVAP